MSLPSLTCNYESWGDTVLVIYHCTQKCIATMLKEEVRLSLPYTYYMYRYIFVSHTT